MSRDTLSKAEAGVCFLETPCGVLFSEQESSQALSGLRVHAAGVPAPQRPNPLLQGSLHS